MMMKQIGENFVYMNITFTRVKKIWFAMFFSSDLSRKGVEGNIEDEKKLIEDI